MKKMDSLNNGNARFVRARISQKFLRTCGALIPTIGLFACANIAFAEAKVVPDTENTETQKSVPVAKNTATKLPTTVVVATRTEVALEKLAPSVTVISGEELGVQQQTTSLSSIFVQQAGIDIVGTGTGTTSLFMRGTESDMTALMLDGRMLNGGIYGPSGALNTLTVDNLASIQILRGSASTLYGSSAIGGAIDLRTVNGLDVDKPTGSIAGEWGSFGTTNFAAKFAGNSIGSQDFGPGILGFSAGISYQNSNGYNWNNGYEKTVFLPRLDYKLSENLSFDLISRIYENSYDLPGDKFSKTYTDWQKDSGWLISPEIKFKPIETLSGKIIYSYSESKSKGEAMGYLENKNKAQQVSFQLDWVALENLLLSAGYDFQQDDGWAWGNPAWGYSSESILQYSNAVWINAQYEVIENLTINAGTRYTDTNKYGDATTYEVGGNYYLEATGTTFSAKISTGFRTPSYTDLSPNFGYTASNDLEAEHSTSYEIGVKQELFDKQLKLGATFFQIEMKDMITSIGWPSVVYNVRRARSRGVEFMAEWMPGNGDYSVYGNATYQQAENRDTDKRLEGRPRFSGTIGAEWKSIEDIIVGGSVTYVRGREGNYYDPATFTSYSNVDMDDYLLARFYASWVCLRYEDGNEKLTITGRIENAFGVNYDSYNIGYDAAPFGAYVGAKLSF